VKIHAGIDFSGIFGAIKDWTPEVAAGRIEYHEVLIDVKRSSGRSATPADLFSASFVNASENSMFADSGESENGNNSDPFRALEVCDVVASTNVLSQLVCEISLQFFFLIKFV